MRVAVLGATGRSGRYMVDRLNGLGHETVPISRSTGVDAYIGTGLAEALAGVDVVVDVYNTRSQDEAQIVDFFGTVTGNLLAAEDCVGVGHHVLLSIVGLNHDQHVPHYAGRREQERQGMAGAPPQAGTATIAPVLAQPIAQREVGEMLAEVATGAPLGRPIDIAGPDTQDLVDMARRTFAARGEQVRLVPTWRGLFDMSMAGEVLLPGEGARLGRVTFDDWLVAGAR